MTIDKRYQQYNKEIESATRRDYSKEEIAAILDVTLLEPTTPLANITDLAQQALRCRAAALCVYPHQLLAVDEALPIKRATVINFPSGNEPLTLIKSTLEQAISHAHAQEIDFVFPYQTYLAGQRQHALAICDEVYQHCLESGVLLKVILETGAFPSDDAIYECSLQVVDKGCHFLKTSTGKITPGATLKSVFSLLTAIIDSNKNTGVKVSGGVKTITQAIEYIQLAEQLMKKPIDASWFRMGASSLLNAFC